MVNTAKVFNDELDSFLRLDIQYNSKYDQYLFQGKWTSTIYYSYFTERNDKLRHLLIEHLKQGVKNKEFLSIVLDQINVAYNSITKWDYDKFSFFEDAIIMIRKSRISKNAPPKEKFDYNYFEKQLYLDNYLKEEFFNLDDEVIDYHYHLVDAFKRSKPTKIEFEQEKLMYCVINFVESIIKLENIINDLYKVCEFTDFSVKNAEKHILQPKRKCQVNLSKIDTAQLFRFLFHEGFITMNDEDTNDEMHIKKFIEENFTYRNLKNKKHVPITKINKQFSELKSYYKETQIKFIDDLIEKLKARKEEVIKFCN